MSETPAERPLRILFVCFGNICRSPMAEGLARQVVTTSFQESAADVSSAGLGAMDGGAPTPEAIAAMRKRGIDISAHRARVVTHDMVASSDLVLAMEERQCERLRAAGAGDRAQVLLRFSEAAAELQKAPPDDWGRVGAAGRIRLVAEAADSLDREGLWARGEHEYDVPDPIGLRVDGYEDVIALIEGPIGSTMAALLGPSRR